MEMIKMSENSKLDSIREIFSKDVYATSTTGIYIEDAAQGYSLCTMPIRPEILNANGFVMGGALFTLADFAFAVASNFDKLNTVSITSQINYLTVAKGTKVTAKAECVRSGKSVCFYDITITDDTGRTVATVSVTGHISG